MGQLRDVQMALERKKRDGDRRRQDAENKRQDAQMNALSAAGYVDNLVKSLKVPVVAPDRFESVAKQLAGGIKGLGKDLGELKAKEVGFDPIYVRFDAIESHITSLVNALNGIEIPTPEIPAVNVAAPNLSPLMDEVALLRQDIASIQINVEANAQDMPKNVIFDIERTRGGYLKRVVARTT